MKFRSALLIACLIVVPLLAMVSHKIPAATRIATRERYWDPMVGTLAKTLGLGAPPPTSSFPRQPVARLPSADDAAFGTAEATPPGSEPALGSLRPTVGPAPKDQSEPRASSLVTAGIEPAPAAVAATTPPPAILLGSNDSLPIGGQTGRESLEARLRALGATRIDWTPGQGGDGLHRCSCRIPAEPTGQLHRVFQAAATDPVAALDNLVGQVTAWSMRSGGTAAGTTSPTLR